MNNIATGLMTPAVSRYDNVLYLSWPLGRLRELDPFDPAWSLPPYCEHALACAHWSSWAAMMLANLVVVCVPYIWVWEWEESLCDHKSDLAGTRRRRHVEAAATFPRA